MVRWWEGNIFLYENYCCIILQHPSASIGTGCRIGPSVVIGPDVVIENGEEIVNVGGTFHIT